MNLIIAIVPVLSLIVLMAFFKMSGDKSSIISLVVTMLIAFFGFHFPLDDLLFSFLYGAMKAVSPILIIILMYLWKNISFSIVLFWSGINWIPQIYHEQCQLDGATGRQEFQYITWILLKPTTLVVLLMSIVNSFKVFKEIYMLYGAYPSPYVYMLQHYMNNQFLSLNMQKLSAAAWCMFIILGIFLGIIYRVQRRNLDYL